MNDNEIVKVLDAVAERLQRMRVEDADPAGTFREIRDLVAPGVSECCPDLPHVQVVTYGSIAATDATAYGHGKLRRLSADIRRAALRGDVVIMLDGSAPIAEIARRWDPYACVFCMLGGGTDASPGCECGGTGFAKLNLEEHTEAVRELVDQTYVMRARIDTAQKALNDAAGVEAAARRRATVLADAAGTVQSAAAELRHAVADLERIDRTPADACRIEWGVCPMHGNTLRTVDGGMTICRQCENGGVQLPGQVAPGRWGHDRCGFPCPDPVTADVTFTDGTVKGMCGGHTHDAVSTLEGVTVRYRKLRDEHK